MFYPFISNNNKKRKVYSLFLTKTSDKVATQLNKARGDLIGLISFKIGFGLGFAEV